MFRGIPIAELSSSAGVAEDGIVLGSIAQSELLSAQGDLAVASSVFALTFNEVPDIHFTNVSTEAGNATPDDFLPFGTDMTFSADDQFYIACDGDIEEVFFKVTTAGDWAGTGFALFDSTDGMTANRQLTGVVDTSDGFRDGTGIYQVTWDQPEAPRVAFSPVPGHITSRKWIVIKTVGWTAVTTAPKLQQMWIKQPLSEAPYVDYTAVLNAELADETFGSFIDDLVSFFTTEEALYMCFPFLTIGVDWAVYRKLLTPCTRVYEYLAEGEIWKTLSNVNDPSNGQQNGPSTNTGTPNLYATRWPIPADWAAISLGLPPDAPVTGYWVRIRTTEITDFAPVLVPEVRVRSRTLGDENSTGVIHHEAVTYTRVGVLVLNTPPSGDDTIAQVINTSTGAAGTFILPDGIEAPYEVELTPSVTVNEGEQALIMFVDGATASGLVLNVRT